MRRVRVRVSGEVQGVGFRRATQRQALALGLTGWVRNLAGGDVELEAQGAPAVVDQLVAWCGHGPPSARVTAVHVDELAAIDGGRDFVVEPGRR